MENRIKVSSKSNMNRVAGAIIGILNELNEMYIDVIGAGSLNQAIKAIAIARGYGAPSGIELMVQPSFKTIEVDGRQLTSIQLKVVKV